MNQFPVLLVEDDENDVEFMRYAWKKEAIPNPLHVVTDGQMAQEYLSGSGQYADRDTHPLPCFVLLDLNMPYLNGFEVLEWIRKQDQFRTLPVAVLTASSADTDARKAYALMANSYVIKPSSPDRLREFVTSARAYWMGWNYAPPCTAPLSKSL